MTKGSDEVTPAAELEESRALIDPSAADWGPEAFKAAFGLIPVVGPLAGFAIDQLPGRRMNRVVTYLHLLHDRVGGMAADLDNLQRQWEQRPEASSLFYSGVSAAADATSEARLERLASVVASGLTAGEVTAMNAARRIRLLRDMDDGEFALLVIVERERRITVRYADDYSWIDDGTVTFISTGDSAPPPDLPRELSEWLLADLSTALNHLAGLGLIEANLAQHSKAHGAIRSYVATPAGQELVRIVAGSRS